MDIFETLNHVKTLVKLHKEEGIPATVTTEVTMKGEDACFWINTEDNISFEINNGIKEVYEVTDYSENCVYLRGWDERLKVNTQILITTNYFECNGRVRIQQH